MRFRAMKYWGIIAALALGLGGCAQCSPTSATQTKIVPILSADFGVAGQDISGAIGDICEIANLISLAPTPAVTQ